LVIVWLCKVYVGSWQQAGICPMFYM